jgi:hypothetical protein
MTLNGSSLVNVVRGERYTDLGVKITDNEFDASLLPTVTYTKDGNTVASIDTSVIGTYIIHYNVKDLAGNPAAEVTRTVVVTRDVIVEWLNPVDHFVLGGEVKVTIKVTNKSPSKRNAALIVGLFDQNDKLIMSAGAEQEIAVNGSVQLQTMFLIPSTTPNNGRYTVKYIVQNALEGDNTPLTDTVSIEVQKSNGNSDKK